MLRMLFAASAALLFTSSPAMAESWREVATADEYPAIIMFVDADSISKKGDVVRFRTQSYWEDVTDTRDFDRSIIQRDARCSTLESRPTDSQYFANGKLLDRDPTVGDWTKFEKESLLGYGIRVICGAAEYTSGPVDPATAAGDFFDYLNDY